jgi:hypothetical protein
MPPVRPTGYGHRTGAAPRPGGPPPTARRADGRLAAGAVQAGPAPRRRRPVRPRQRGLALGMLGLFLLSLAAILFVLYQLVLAEGVASATAALRARPTPIPTPLNAQRFNSLAEFDRAQHSPPGAPFVIVISEAELNGRIASSLQKQPNLPFRDVAATIHDDRVDFTGSVRAAGLGIASAVGLKPRAVSSRLGYELLSIDFGPVPVPDVARQAISDTIDRELEKARLTEGFALDAVQAREGAVTLVGRFK